MTFAAACAALALIGLPDGSLGVAWPSLRASLDLPQAALGLVLASVGAGTFCAGLFSGRLLGALHTRALLAAAAMVAGCGLCAMAAADGTGLLCAGAVLLGLGAGSLDCGVNAVAVFGFDARRVNWMHGCYGLGAMSGPLAMLWLLTHAGLSWRAGYAALSAILLVAAALFAFGVGLAGTARPVQRDAAGPVRRDAARPGPAAGRDGWAAARHPLVLPQLVLFFVYTGVEVTLGQWSFTVLTEHRLVPPGTAGVLASAYWASLAAGRFVLGIAVRRVGADRLLRLCTVVVVAGALGFAAAPGAWGGIGLIVAGGALAPVFPTLMARAPDRLGAAVALHAVGFKVSAAMLGAAALPALAGLVARLVGLGAVAWLAAAGALLLLALHEALLRLDRRLA